MQNSLVKLQIHSKVKRILFPSRTVPFWICLGGIVVLFLLERYPTLPWEGVRSYFLSRPYFYHSLVFYLVALVLALFTYRNLYNVKVLLASVLFLLAGVYSLLFFFEVSLPLKMFLKIPEGGIGARLFIYFFYSQALLLIALVPTYLSKPSTRILLFLLVLVEGMLLVGGSRYLLPTMEQPLGRFTERPMVILLFTNLCIAGISYALSLYRKDPYAWAVTGFLVLFTFAFWVRGEKLEKLFLHWVPVSLVLTVLINLITSLWHRANYDPLLLIYSRGYINNLLQGKGKGLGKQYALALFDLDHFKKINDRYGHSAGDAVLYEVAQKIREKSLPRGITCRYGGEEILVVFPETSLDYAERVGREVVSAVGGMKIPYTGKKRKRNLRITVSGGVVAGMAGKDHVQNLLEAADKAMYRSKRLGRNRMSVSRGGRGSR